MAGFIMVPRSMFDASRWREERHSRREAWIDLFALAAWKETTLTSKGHRVTLQRGQVLASTRMLALRWRWDKDSVTAFLSSLLGTHIQVVGRTLAGTIYSIVQYPISDYAYEPTSDTKPDSKPDTEPDSKPDSQPDKKKKLRSKEVPASQGSWPARAAEIWNQATGGVLPIPRVGRELKALVDAKGGFDVIESAWLRFCSSSDSQFGPTYFASRYGQYNGGAPQLSKKQSEERDQQLNRDQAIQRHVAEMREAHKPEWWEAMKVEAKNSGRWVVPYVYDKFKGGSSGKP
jgi:hypothetical protein